MNSDFDIIKKTREIKEVLKPISLHDNVLSKCVLILIYYPMKESKIEIYTNLDKREKVGFLTRYILGVASKIGIYQTLIKEIVTLKQDYKKYKIYIMKYKNDNKFWKECLERNQRDLTKQFSLLLDMMLEEITRRNEPKYLRKKKLEELKQNLQN